MRPILVASLAIGLAATAAGADATTPERGIAADHPGDAGIASDPRVLFADGFEGHADLAALDAFWGARFHQVALTRDPGCVNAGAQAVEMTMPESDEEVGAGLGRTLAEPVDVLHLRYYSKFESTFDVVGSSHNGGDISAQYNVDGRATPGVPADGTNKFLISFENWRGEASTANPGAQNVYIYHPGQRSGYGDHFFPDGTVLPNTSLPGDFGPDFVPRPAFTPELGRWYCYEVMLRANTPGERDGRVTCWIDGEVVADFPNLRLRDVPTLRIDRFGLSLHARANPATTRKWYDDVVAATAYIGPLAR